MTLAPTAPPPADLPDGDLVARARAGDGDSFAELYGRYFEAIYDFAARICRDRDDASDVAQETFIKAFRSLGQLEDPARFKSWLFSIARNTALNRLRAPAGVETVRIGEDLGEGLGLDVVDPHALSDPALVAEAEAVAELVWEAAAGLSASDYTMLDLHVRRDLGGVEMAQALGTTPNSVYVRLNRAKKSFERSVEALLLLKRGRVTCAALDGELQAAGITGMSPKAVQAIERHVAACPICSVERDRLVAAAPLAVFGALAPVAAPASIKAAVLAASAAGIAGAAAGTAATATGGAGAGAATGVGGAGGLGGTTLAAGAGVAATIAVAAAAIAYSMGFFTGSVPPADPAATPTRTPTAAAPAAAPATPTPIPIAAVTALPAAPAPRAAVIAPAAHVPAFGRTPSPSPSATPTATRPPTRTPTPSATPSPTPSSVPAVVPVAVLGADLALTIGDSVDPVPLAGTTTYTIRVTNRGPGVAVAAILTIGLPGGTTVSSATSSQGSCTAAASVVCHPGNIAPGGAVEVLLTVRFPDAGTKVLAASVESSTPDPHPGGNTATEQTVVAAPRVSFSVAANPATASVGQEILFTYTVRNAGLIAVHDIAVADPNCSPVTLLSGDIDGDRWLDPGEAWVFTCRTPFKGSMVGPATVEGVDGGGNGVNGSSAVIIQPATPGLVLSRTASATAGLPGQVITLGYVLTNTGQLDLLNPALSDNACSGVAFKGGDADGDARLDPGETWSYQCSKALSGDLVSTATATATASGGLVVSRTAGMFVDALPAPAVARKVSPSFLAEPGGPYSVQVTLTNGGVEPLQVVSLSDSQWSQPGNAGDCSVPFTLAGGEARTCGFTASFSGGPGATGVGTATARFADDDGNSVVRSATSTVTIVDVPSSIAVTARTIVAAPAQRATEVSLSVTVTNTSTVDHVGIVGLSALMDGSVLTIPGCSLPGDLAPGQGFTCSASIVLPGAANGANRARSLPSLVLTAVAVDDDGHTIEASIDVDVKSCGGGGGLGDAPGGGHPDKPNCGDGKELLGVTFASRLAGAIGREAIRMTAAALLRGWA